MKLVRDIMTTDVTTVKPETSIRELAEIFETKHFGSLPVVDDEANLVGIVSSSDLVEQGRNLHIPTVISLFDWVIPLGGERTLERDLQKITAQTVGEICSREVVTINPADSLGTAADLMSTHKLHALPVVENSRLVGIIARMDIIRNLNA